MIVTRSVWWCVHGGGSGPGGGGGDGGCTGRFCSCSTGTYAGATFCNLYYVVVVVVAVVCGCFGGVAGWCCWC